MICQHCQAEVDDLPYCPHCGSLLDHADKVSPQNTTSSNRSKRRARRRHFLRRWLLPVFALLAIIAFGVLGLALMGFRDGSQDRELANRHQAEIHYNRGQVYLEWGQYQLAEAEFEEAVRLSPDYTEADKNRRIAQVKQTVTPTTTPQPTAAPSPA